MTDLNLLLAANPVAYVRHQQEHTMGYAQITAPRQHVGLFMEQAREPLAEKRHDDEMKRHEALKADVLALLDKNPVQTAAMLVEGLIVQGDRDLAFDDLGRIDYERVDYETLGLVLGDLAVKGIVSIDGPEEPKERGGFVPPLTVRLRIREVGGLTYVLDDDHLRTLRSAS